MAVLLTPVQLLIVVHHLNDCSIQYTHLKPVILHVFCICFSAGLACLLPILMIAITRRQILIIKISIALLFYSMLHCWCRQTRIESISYYDIIPLKIDYLTQFSMTMPNKIRSFSFASIHIGWLWHSSYCYWILCFRHTPNVLLVWVFWAKNAIYKNLEWCVVRGEWMSICVREWAGQ